MKNKYLIITLFALLFSCSSLRETKDTKSSIQNAVVDFYSKKKEINKKQGHNIYKNFEGLTRIISLTDTAKFNYEKGIYKVSINITHTTVHLILIDENKFKIVELDNNIDTAINEAEKFLAVTDFPHKLPSRNYIEEITNIFNDNLKITESHKIKSIP